MELGQQKDFYIGEHFMQRALLNQQTYIRKSHGGFVRWSVNTAEVRFPGDEAEILIRMLLTGEERLK